MRGSRSPGIMPLMPKEVRRGDKTDLNDILRGSGPEGPARTDGPQYLVPDEPPCLVHAAAMTDRRLPPRSTDHREPPGP